MCRYDKLPDLGLGTCDSRANGVPDRDVFHHTFVRMALSTSVSLADGGIVAVEHFVKDFTAIAVDKDVGTGISRGAGHGDANGIFARLGKSNSLLALTDQIGGLRTKVVALTGRLHGVLEFIPHRLVDNFNPHTFTLGTIYGFRLGLGIVPVVEFDESLTDVVYINVDDGLGPSVCLGNADGY